MKKICALLVVTMVLTCSSAFALQIGAGKIISASDGAAAPNTYVLPTFAKLSTGVSMGYLTSVGTYAIVTKHVNGDKVFGAAANDGKNYVKDANVNDTAPDVTHSDSAEFGSGWSSM